MYETPNRIALKPTTWNQTMASITTSSCEICTAAYSSNFLTTFWDNLSSRVQKSKTENTARLS